jgi:hypothetical protein
MAKARVSQFVVEVIAPTPARNPATPTGAGVTQFVVEALLQNPTGKARVTQYLLQCIVQDNPGIPQTNPTPIVVRIEPVYGLASHG